MPNQLPFDYSSVTQLINSFLVNNQLDTMRSKHSINALLSLAVIAVVLMSFVPVLIRYTQANEATIGIIRLAIASVGLAIILLFTRGRVVLNPKEWRWLGFLGFVFAIHWYAYFKSIKLADASLAAIGVATFGVHLLLLNAAIFKEKLSLIDLMAVLIAFIGIYVASPQLSIDSEKLLGFAIAVVSGFLYACLPLINRQLSHLTTNTRGLGQFGFALLFFALLLPQANFDLSRTDWLSLAALGVVCTLVAHTIWIKVSTELPANFTAVIYYGYVPLAMMMSYFFLGEAITWQKVVGASMIIGANILVIFKHKKNQKESKALERAAEETL
ncbi:DMT family transporter [Aliikangiella marina]|uniref:DMT family transporter n=1 Tax=Aliikangiella marina TaxID=1712262 RepID=A0A545T4Y6_9GAMM|nr:DMT family transporter [Aliikangiella marina]TQV72276.1 DMT family transporter [Aliikangiella marina]